MPEIVDVIYASNPIFFRMNQQNRRIVQGGYQIEVPFVYSRFSNGGPYQGYDTLNVAPNDTVKNGAWDWKQQYVPVSVDSLTLMKTDSPQAIANFIKFSFTQAEMELADLLGTGLMSDMSDSKQIDGFKGAIDAGSVSTTYAGLTRSSNTFLNSQVDSSTAVLTLNALQSHFMNCKSGGRTPTLIASRVEQYNRFVNLGLLNQQFQIGPTGSDEILESAGFTNVLFNNTPWVEDSHVFDGPDTSNSAILTFNEDYIQLAVNSRADFALEDFQKPIDQDAFVAKIYWAGNLIVTNPPRQGKMTAVAG